MMIARIRGRRPDYQSLDYLRHRRHDGPASVRTIRHVSTEQPQPARRYRFLGLFKGLRPRIEAKPAVGKALEGSILCYVFRANMRRLATFENEIRWPRRVLTLTEAVKYIDATGYCMLFPVRNVPLPSLYYAVTRRGLQGEWKWDKYSSMVWRWKDELPRRRRAVYAKYFRGRGTFISLKFLPYFLTMEGSAVAEGDHDGFYAEGRIRDDCRIIWEALEEHGPLATLELRNACKMDTKAGNIRFKRAILELQCMLIVVHFGAEQETNAWASGRYELMRRAFAKQTEAARQLSSEDARTWLAAKFRERNPDASPTHLTRLFGWLKAEAAAAWEGTMRPSRVPGQRKASQ
jgi:hypothetical protein